MLQRVIAIKNVGRFRNSAATPNPPFAKHTLVFAPNGYGKTTFCTVMRSVQSGDAAPVIGRRTLGAGAAPEIDLLFADANRRLQDGAWSAPASKISVFDGVFVAENVHSGDVVDVTHKRGLYRVIVGREGVGLAEQQHSLVRAAKIAPRDLGQRRQGPGEARGRGWRGSLVEDGVERAEGEEVDGHQRGQARLEEARMAPPQRPEA